MTKLLVIAAGGALGALLRYTISGFTYQFMPHDFPWGTLCVNLVGCFMIGFLWELSNNLLVGQHLKNFVFIGGLGAFTTFSTFGLETLNLLRDGETKFAALNLLTSNLLGLALVFLGFLLGRFLFSLVR